MKARATVLLLCGSLAAGGCRTSGSDWMSQPLPGDEDLIPGDEDLTDGNAPEPSEPTPPPPGTGAPTRAQPVAKPRLEGRVLGKFRNTYYDFPSESDHEGDPVELKDARCKTIRSVPRGFYDAVCVQGSGTLKTGSTVSFAKRDCECAALCPRTNQRICFDELDRERFPWGRGATGKPITPLLTVAVDDTVIPLGTALYVPELDGLPTGAPEAGARHDGCFIAQDRGLKVKGKHVDVFTGLEAVTRLWNELVPSNQGVTVVLDSPRCARAPMPAAE